MALVVHVRCHDATACACVLADSQLHMHVVQWSRQSVGRVGHRRRSSSCTCRLHWGRLSHASALSM